ncbi:MAG TPA: type II toxin-antitoxin system RelE/ParE family toxin [Bacteroidota bacterium]|nr:type II toxin-antitoxin system RelE/ParE family toxin [Bacteroidota bacterium]
MAQITWSRQANTDLVQIAEYIRRDSIQYAKAVVSGIVRAVERLEQFPEMGRVVPELSDKNIREIIVPPYRIIYRLSRTQCEIIGVIHSRQDI